MAHPPLKKLINIYAEQILTYVSVSCSCELCCCLNHLLLVCDFLIVQPRILDLCLLAVLDEILALGRKPRAQYLHELILRLDVAPSALAFCRRHLDEL